MYIAHLAAELFCPNRLYELRDGLGIVAAVQVILTSPAEY